MERAGNLIQVKEVAGDQDPVSPSELMVKMRSLVSVADTGTQEKVKGKVTLVTASLGTQLVMAKGTAQLAREGRQGLVALDH